MLVLVLIRGCLAIKESVNVHIWMIAHFLYIYRNCFEEMIRSRDAEVKVRVGDDWLPCIMFLLALDFEGELIGGTGVPE